MPYVGHTRLVMGGYLGSTGQPVEEWTNTLNFVSQPNFAPLSQTVADDAHVFAVNYIEAASLKFSNDTHLSFLKVATVDASGHIPGTVYRTDTPETSGVSTTGRHPYQCSLAVSLLTGLRGPSHRGRFFMPPQNLAIDSGTGLVQLSLVQDMLAGLVATLQGFEQAVGGALIVASSKGYNTPVTGIKVGRVMDTQRRRRRSLPEDYSAPQPL